MSRAWNRTSLGKDAPIRVNRKVYPRSAESYKKILWESLQNRFAPYCGNNETCWLDSVELGKQLKTMSPDAFRILNEFTLKPKGTKKKNGWLSTNEIDYVMQQYEELYPDFVYIGCFPSDYYKLAPNKFPTKVLDTHAKAAIVFNLDESHQAGSHWIAVFFDKTLQGRRIVEYFDPTGDFPNKNLQMFLDQPYFSDAVIKISRKKHQRGDTECGVYSLFYILTRLEGESMEDLNRTRISDTEMNKFRGALFRPYTPTWTMELRASR